MILTRTMTLDADLPDAPAGREWRLVTSDHGQVALYHGDTARGLLTGIGPGFLGIGVKVDLVFWPHNQTRRPIGTYDNERQAAAALFDALGY
jgi:hypothetical protein